MPACDPTNHKPEGAEKWRPNYARNANRPILVALAITTKRANAPRPLAPIRLLNQPSNRQATRKIEIFCDPDRLSAHDDKLPRDSRLVAPISARQSETGNGVRF